MTSSTASAAQIVGMSLTTASTVLIGPSDETPQQWHDRVGPRVEDDPAPDATPDFGFEEQAPVPTSTRPRVAPAVVASGALLAIGLLARRRLHHAV